MSDSFIFVDNLFCKLAKLEIKIGSNRLNGVQKCILSVWHTMGLTSNGGF